MSLSLLKIERNMSHVTPTRSPLASMMQCTVSVSTRRVCWEPDESCWERRRGMLGARRVVLKTKEGVLGATVWRVESQTSRAGNQGPRVGNQGGRVRSRMSRVGTLGAKGACWGGERVGAAGSEHFAVLGATAHVARRLGSPIVFTRSAVSFVQGRAVGLRRRRP